MIYSRNWLSAVMRNNNYYDITEINKTGWYYCKSKDRIEFWEAPAKKKRHAAQSKPPAAEKKIPPPPVTEEIVPAVIPPEPAAEATAEAAESASKGEVTDEFQPVAP